MGINVSLLLSLFVLLALELLDSTDFLMSVHILCCQTFTVVCVGIITDYF
jgi:hypothetical protein